jgi:hypothetical protein
LACNDLSHGFVQQGRLQHQTNEAIYLIQMVKTPVFERGEDVKNKSCERGIILASKRRVF